jgi:site-specific DNA recombinase
MNNQIQNIKEEKIIWVEYNRRSSDEGSGKQIVSIEKQQEELSIKFPATKFKRTLHLWESKSAFKENNRPNFTNMVDLIKKGKITGIICYSPCRLSRNPIEAGIIVDLIVKGLLKDIKFAGYTFDNSAEGIMLLQFSLSQSQYFSAKLSRDVRVGNRIHLERGQWITIAPPGYLNMENPTTKEKYVDKDPERFETIKNALLDIISGKRPMDVLRKIQDSGYKTRKTKSLGDRKLSRASFYRIITDPFYCGLMRRREGDFPGKHPIMITPKQYDQLQIRLGRKGKSRYAKNNFAYKDVLRCGECGGSITCEEKYQIICPVCKTKFHRGKNTDACKGCGTKIEDMDNPKILHYISYHCTKRVHKDCAQGGISLENLEEKIDSELQKFEIDIDFRDWAIDHLGETNSKEEQMELDVRERLEKNLRECDWNINNLIKLRTRRENIDSYEDEEKQQAYDFEENRLFAEKRSLKKQIDELDECQVNRIELTKETFDFAYYARQHFADGDVMTKTMILSRLGTNLVIRDRKLHIDGETAFFLIEKGKKEIEGIVESLEPSKRPDNSKALLVLDSVCQSWRRRWDSNPRVLSNTRFPGVRHKPLGDSS